MKFSEQCSVLIENNFIFLKLPNLKRGIFKTIGQRLCNRVIDDLLKIVIFFLFPSNFHKIFLYFNQKNISQKLIDLPCKNEKQSFNFGIIYIYIHTCILYKTCFCINLCLMRLMLDQ